MAEQYRITRFYKYEALDRKVMVVEVTDDEKPDDPPRLREFYWERTAYTHHVEGDRPDADLSDELRQLLGAKNALAVPAMETIERGTPKPTRVREEPA